MTIEIGQDCEKIDEYFEELVDELFKKLLEYDSETVTLDKEYVKNKIRFVVRYAQQTKKIRPIGCFCDFRRPYIKTNTMGIIIGLSKFCIEVRCQNHDGESVKFLNATVFDISHVNWNETTNFKLNFEEPWIPIKSAAKVS